MINNQIYYLSKDEVNSSRYNDKKIDKLRRSQVSQYKTDKCFVSELGWVFVSDVLTE